MTFYIILTIYMFLIFIFSIYKDHLIKDKALAKKIETFIFISTLVFLWFITAFRAKEIGNDTVSYFHIFNKYNTINKLNIWDRMEIGWQLLCVFVGFFTKNPYVFIIFITSILYGLTGLYIYRYSENKIVSLVVFYSLFFSSYFNIIRQCLSIILIAFAYQYRKSKNNYACLLLIILSSSIHITGLLGFLFFLDVFMIRSVVLIVSVSLLIVFFSVNGQFYNLVKMVLPDRYIGYLTSKYAFSGYLSVTITYLEMLGIAYLMLRAKNKCSKLDYLNLACMLCITSFAYINNLFTRVSSSFMFIFYNDLYTYVYTSKIKYKKLIIFTVVTLLLLKFIVQLYLRPEWNHLYPYYFMWN